MRVCVSVANTFDLAQFFYLVLYFLIGGIPGRRRITAIIIIILL